MRARRGRLGRRALCGDAPTGMPLPGGHRLGVGTFVDDEGGYTTVAVAVALLLSLVLLFSAATAQWATARSADVQEVADACALAGENTVAGFVTVAQVLDACVLSLGLAGVLTYGVGLITCAIPGLQGAGATIVDGAKKILDARQSFATTCAEGLERLEAALPYLVVVSSASCVSANATGTISYVGCAVPYPLKSESSYASLDDLVDTEDLDDAASDLQDASARAEEYKAAADAALLRGWFCDCSELPHSLRERVDVLSSVPESLNPLYPTVEGWNFGVPLKRARYYYQARLDDEAPDGTGVDARRASACRWAFYDYALGEVRGGHFEQAADGSVDIDLPSLPHNTSEVRETSIYTEAIWPCTVEDGVVTLHAYASCPGATGASAGVASLSQMSSGVAECDVCHMGVGDMGKVASASTNIDNGFEYHWKEIVEAAEDYEDAKNKQVDAEEDMKDIAEDASLLYEKALAALAVPRPKLCPAGAWGCVAVVARGSGTATPSELTASFVEGTDLPAGVAVSAATLAPDEATAQNNVLASLLDGLDVAADSGALAGMADAVLDCWGSLLVSYGSGYQTVSDAADDLFEGIEGVAGEKVASWLQGKLEDLVEVAGFTPCDMSLRKPVLVNTSDVLGQAGLDDDGTLRGLIQALPPDAGPAQMAYALGIEVVSDALGGTVTIAELPIPGTDATVTLTLDLKELAGAL